MIMLNLKRIKTKAQTTFEAFTAPPPPLPPSEHPVKWIDEALQEDAKHILLSHRHDSPEAQTAYKEAHTRCVSHAYWQGYQDSSSPALVSRYHDHPYLLTQGSFSSSALLAAYIEGLRAGLKSETKDAPSWRELLLTKLGQAGWWVVTYALALAAVAGVFHALGWL
jgi:cytochrome P450